MLQAYRGSYERWRIIPYENFVIPEGSELIITVLEQHPNNRARRQQEAFLRFMESMDNTPPLPDEFDEIIARRVNITREVEI